MSDDEWEQEAEEQPQWEQSARKPAAAAANDDEDDWENEVDLVEQDLNKQVAPKKKTAAQIEAERKAAEAKAAQLAARVKTVELEEETPEQRLERERAQQEESEVGLIGDLLGSAGSRGGSAARGGQSLDTRIATAPLSTKKDHEVFAKTVAERLRDSTPLHLSAFCNELLPRFLERLGAEQVRQLADLVEGYVKKAAAPAQAKATAPAGGKKKKQVAKKFQDTFGGDYDYHAEGHADRYLDMEDDFM